MSKVFAAWPCAATDVAEVAGILTVRGSDDDDDEDEDDEQDEDEDQNDEDEDGDGYSE